MHEQKKWGRWTVAVLALVGLGLALANVFVDNMPKGEVQKVVGYVPWDKETVKMIETLPVQDGGRIKPFSTFASFKMLGFHGARSMKVMDGEGKVHKIKPTEWMMDLLFRPELTRQMPTFRIDNSKVLESIGLEQKGRRDRYSYDEVVGGIEKLARLAETYEAIEKNERDPMQQQTIDLAYNLMSYRVLLSYFDFVRSGIVLTGSGENGAPDKTAKVSHVLAILPEIRRTVMERQRSGEGVAEGIESMIMQLQDRANSSRHGFIILPPGKEEKKQWRTAGNVIYEVVMGETATPADDVSDIAAMEVMVTKLAENGEEGFREELGNFKQRVEKRANARGELKKLSLEVMYFKSDKFLHAMVLFLLGSVCALGMWGSGAGRLRNVLYWGTMGFTVAATLLCTVAIVIRCLIMSRPPVGNLYDTIIFIAATCVILAFFVEWLSRKTFALGMAPILGMALIILARRYEVGDAKDHLDPLVAVLDSNFWLTTHVITITLGYSAGLLAAMLSAIYVLMRGLNLDGGNKDLRSSLTKSVYGCICLTVFLALVGTVLGGIWGNYSWGRFWGWDPKENGALMICLWTLAILHARLGGLIKEWGLHLASLFTACVVAFSWWHVNFLNVGLHNYGFTAGESTIWWFYIIVFVFILFGVTMMLIESAAKDAKKKEREDISLRASEA